MITWTKHNLDRVEACYRSSKTPDEGLDKVRLFCPAATYDTIRRALSRHGRPPIRELLGKALTGAELAQQHGFKPFRERAHIEKERLLDHHPIVRPFPPSKKLERLLFLPDVHAPFQDRRAVELACAIIKIFKPDHLIQLGDLADMYSVSTFDKKPGRKVDYDWEVEGTNEVLDQFDAANTGKKYITLGNHEYRVEKEIGRNSPAFANRIGLVKDLRLKERGWHVTPYKSSLKIGKLIVT